MNKLKIILVSLIITVGSFVGVTALATTSAGAQNADIQNSLCSGTNLMENGGDCNEVTANAGDSINSLVATVINIFSWVVGVVCVIMIIYGGFLYVTGGGDTTKVETAKKTIMFAIIGLVIVALAQIIVKFVLQKVTQTQS